MTAPPRHLLANLYRLGIHSPMIRNPNLQDGDHQICNEERICGEATRPPTMREARIRDPETKNCPEIWLELRWKWVREMGKESVERGIGQLCGEIGALALENNVRRRGRTVQIFRCDALIDAMTWTQRRRRRG